MQPETEGGPCFQRIINDFDINRQYDETYVGTVTNRGDASFHPGYIFTSCKQNFWK